MDDLEKKQIDENSKRHMDQLDKWASRFKDWAKAHGKDLPPPIHGGSDGELHWLNRAARRRMQRKSK